VVPLLPHVFDEFRQVDGSVTARSEPGVGSTFTVELPLRFQPSPATSAAA